MVERYVPKKKIGKENPATGLETLLEKVRKAQQEGPGGPSVSRGGKRRRSNWGKGR